MTAMSINNPKHWQERATEMRVVAQAIDDQRAREEMLKVASNYERMAKRAHVHRFAELLICDSALAWLCPR